MDPMVALAIALSVEDKAGARRKRRKWAKRWFLKRGREFGNGHLLRELRTNEPGDYKNYMRMDAKSFDELLEIVTPKIVKQDTVMRAAISPRQRLAITLRYLATGNTFEDLKFSNAVSPQAIGRIVIETCKAICTSLQGYIQLPKDEHEWKVVADLFNTQWNFPHCIGAIDGKHVAIKKPHGSGSFYFNYKGFFSIVLMGVVNANYEFLMVDVGMNGRISDGGVISETKFGQKLESNELSLPEPEKLHDTDSINFPYVFVGDDAFSLSENLMKPYGGEMAGQLNVPKRVFNYRVSRARRVVENAFGILVSRFGVLQSEILLSTAKAKIVTLSCCYLHNFLRKKSRNYFLPGCADWEEDNGQVHYGTWRESQIELVGLQATYSRNMSERAKGVREAFKKYFMTKGSVWQLESVH